MDECNLSSMDPTHIHVTFRVVPEDGREAKDAKPHWVATQDDLTYNDWLELCQNLTKKDTGYDINQPKRLVAHLNDGQTVDLMTHLGDPAAMFFDRFNREHTLVEAFI